MSSFNFQVQRYADMDAKKNVELYNQMSSLKSDDFCVQGHPLIGINIQSNPISHNTLALLTIVIQFPIK